MRRVMGGRTMLAMLPALAMVAALAALTLTAGCVDLDGLVGGPSDVEQAADTPGEPSDAGDAAAEDDEAAVRGTVDLDGDPVGDARVTVVDPDEGEIASTRTGGDGAWSLSLPAPATYELVLDAASLPADTELVAGDERRRTVTVERGQTLRRSWSLRAAPASPLASAVTDRMAQELGVDRDGLLVRCPELDRYVAGELVVCDIAEAPEPLGVDEVLVSFHGADGEHVALPWRGTGAPPDLNQVIVAAGGSGQFCADVNAAGYGYQEAVAYWFHEGQPNRMDAARDGIPCGTVYPSTEIDRYWDAVRVVPDD